MENNTTLQEALEAQEYYRNYIRVNGGDPFSPEDSKPQRWWPDDIKEAYDKQKAFFDSLKEEHIIT